LAAIKGSLAAFCSTVKGRSNTHVGVSRALRLLLVLSIVLAGVAVGDGRARDSRASAQPSDIPRGRIAYIGPDGNVWTVTSDGRDQQKLTEDERAWSPRWSPLGNRIAYATSIGGGDTVGGRVNVVSIDGRSNVTVFEFARPNKYNAPTSIQSVDWLPDGRLLVSVLITRLGGVGGGIVCLVDPSTPQHLFDQSCPDEVENVPMDFRVADDGAIAGTEWEPDPQALTTRTMNEGIILLEDLRATAWRLVDTSGDPYVQPSSSPDGQHVAYAYQGALKMVARDGSAAQEIATLERGAAGGWSPDGRYLLFAKGSQDDSDVLMVDARGGSAPIEVARGSDPDWQPYPPNPVMLVHGVGSNVEVWGTQTNPGLLQRLQPIYGEENVVPFDYGDEDPAHPCHAQGDIEDYARKLANDVRDVLSRARQQSGRDDLKVDFIVHSMGGLIVRRYLQTEEGRASTGRVVFLHTPHQGSYLESVQELQGYPVLSLLLKGLSVSVGKALGFDLSCPAHQQMKPDSGFLADLNRTGLPQGVGLSNFFSNIRVSPYTSIWGIELPLAPFNVGDTAVTLADARLPGDCVAPDGLLSLLLADPREIDFACSDGTGSGATLGVAFGEARLGLPDLGLCALAGELCAALGVETGPDIQAFLSMPQSHLGVMKGIVDPGRTYTILPEGRETRLLDAILKPAALVAR
jgi:pimeloyl-ACP methyl ester carboxylesterase